MNKDNGGPAFPITTHHVEQGHAYVEVAGGMTLRDYFAGQSISAAFIQVKDKIGSNKGPYNIPAIVADIAYKIADAMLKERARHGGA